MQKKKLLKKLFFFGNNFFSFHSASWWDLKKNVQKYDFRNKMAPKNRFYCLSNRNIGLFSEKHISFQRKELEVRSKKRKCSLKQALFAVWKGFSSRFHLGPVSVHLHTVVEICAKFQAYLLNNAFFKRDIINLSPESIFSYKIRWGVLFEFFIMTPKLYLNL